MKMRPNNSGVENRLRLHFPILPPPPDGFLPAARPVFVYTVPMTRHAELSFADSLKSNERTGFYERHKPIAVLMILIGTIKGDRLLCLG